MRFTLAFWLLAVAPGLVLADEEKPASDKPVPGLKRKVRPPEPPAPDKPPPTKDPKPGEKEPTDPPAKSEPEKIQEKEVFDRLARNLRNAQDKLNARDAGGGTQQFQRDVLKDLDALIQRAQQDSPQNQHDKGQQGQQANQDPQQGSQKQQGQKQQGQKQQGKQNTMAGGGGARGSKQGKAPQTQSRPGSKVAGKQSPSKPKPSATTSGQGGKPTAGRDENMNKIADLYKEIWGHLPETLRMEMDSYSREAYLGKYHDLLKQYYSSIAEKSGE